MFSWGFLLRVIIAGGVALAGWGLFNLNFLTFPKYLKKDVEVSTLFDFKTAHWTYTCRLLGFLFFTTNPFTTEWRFSLPMTLLTFIKELGAEGMELVILYTFPFVFALIFRSIQFGKLFGMFAVRYIWFRYMLFTGVGMSIGQGFELLGRLIALAEPGSGSLLYFVFYALIICQVIYIGWNIVHFAISFFFSLFTREALEIMAAEFRVSRMEAMKRGPASDSGSKGSSDASSSRGFRFPASLEIGGETYRLEHSDNEKAQYYCPRTGQRRQVRKEQID